MAPPKAGLKTGHKAVGQAVSRAQFVNIPLLRTPMNTPRNLKTAARCVKSDIDELFHEQASKQFKNQSELLKKALAEVSIIFDGILIATDTCGRPLQEPVRMPGNVLKLSGMA
jgi:hypothetical protein